MLVKYIEVQLYYKHICSINTINQVDGLLWQEANLKVQNVMFVTRPGPSETPNCCEDSAGC